jgi:hypothetical protein
MTVGNPHTTSVAMVTSGFPRQKQQENPPQCYHAAKQEIGTQPTQRTLVQGNCDVTAAIPDGQNSNCGGSSGVVPLHGKLETEWEAV